MDSGRVNPSSASDRTASLYLVLVLGFAGGLVGTIYTVGRGAPVGPARPAGPADFPELRGHDPLAGLPADVAGLTTLRVPAPRPPRDPDVFPCSQCHEAGQDDLTQRPLRMAHAELQLAHGPSTRWCFDCHGPEQRDLLRLADGTHVPLDDSTRLCGQCHGRVLRDWNEGIHGLRTGYWTGPRRELLCVHCHDAHAPTFHSLRPLPPPAPPAAR